MALYKRQISKVFLTHEECRETICFICWKKSKAMFPIQNTLKEKLENLLCCELHTYLSDNRLPKVLCTSCRRNVYRQISDKEIDESKKITLPTFAKFFSKSLITRSHSSKSKCDCYLCELSRESPIGKVSKKKSINITSIPKCVKCFATVKKGFPHKCVRTSQVLNLKSEISSLPMKQQEHLISTVVSDLKKINIVENNCSTNNELKLSQPLGKPIRIVVNPEQHKEFRISADDMCKIKNKYNFSTNTALNLAGDLRIAANTRQIIETKLESKLKRKKESVKNFFGTKTFDVIKKSKKKADVEIQQKTVIYCTDLEGLILHVNQQRSNKKNEYHLKFGIDGGRNFLEVCLSVQSLNVNNFIKSDEEGVTKQKRQKYIEGIGVKEFKDGGVKKLFILAACQYTQECNENVIDLWKSLRINDYLGNEYSGTVATDLKLANILLGIQPHSSCHPCTWCYIHKDDLQNCCSEHRTIGNISDYYKAWCKDGSNLKNAKNFKNCTKIPIITGDKNKKVLEIIPPPELHLLIGIVNHVVKHMEAEFQDCIAKWTKLCNVEKQFTNGGHGYNGNSCNMLLKKVDLLRSMCPILGLKYIDVLQTFKIVVNDCFSFHLKSTFKESINNFKSSYLTCGLSVTPKVHAVFYHVAEFCDMRGTGLGFWGEQAMESVHCDFMKLWSRYSVAEDHPDYHKKLLSALIEYNSYHV